MNRGTEDLKNLLRVFENMTVKEYEALYEEAVQYSRNMDVVRPQIIIDSYSFLTKEDYSKIKFIDKAVLKIEYKYKIDEDKFETEPICEGEDIWMNEKALAA